MNEQNLKRITDGRISELLSLRIGDVYQNDKPVSDLLFDRSIVKLAGSTRAVFPSGNKSRRVG